MVHLAHRKSNLGPLFTQQNMVKIIKISGGTVVTERLFFFPQTLTLHK